MKATCEIVAGRERESWGRYEATASDALMNVSRRDDVLPIMRSVYGLSVDAPVKIARVATHPNAQQLQITRSYSQQKTAMRSTKVASPIHILWQRP